MSNIIKALISIVNNSNNKLEKIEKSNNKANIMGDSLEEYIKNCFADTFNCLDEEEKIKKYSEVFSWEGNQNNPPDLILKNSDAIEVKKLNGTGAIALNSSYPKSKLSSKSRMITKDCRECEDNKEWEKDLIYTIGTVKESKIKYLFFVYGVLYSASNDIYMRIKDKIKFGIEEIKDVEFTETNELGKVKKVDPLGITDLRIRGMWSINHPFKVYDYISEINKSKEEKNIYTIYALIPNEKFKSFSKEEIKILEQKNNVEILDKKVKNPNNPSKLMDIKFIKIEILGEL